MHMGVLALLGSRTLVSSLVILGLLKKGIGLSSNTCVLLPAQISALLHSSTARAGQGVLQFDSPTLQGRGSMLMGLNYYLLVQIRMVQWAEAGRGSVIRER